MLSGATPVGVLVHHCYLGCHLSGRRQGRDAVGADADAANADAAGSGDADAAGLLLSWLPYQGEEKGAMLRMLFRC